MRWYDIEPDVYMAISMIECENYNRQIDYAKFIINAIKQKDKEFNYIKNSTKDNLAKKHLRWYDKDITLSTAIEFLKNTTAEIQKEVSLQVLAYKKEKETLLA